MSEVIISVENLGKCYQIGNKQERGYTALRDVITNKAKNVFKGNIRSKSNLTEDFWALKNVDFEIKQGEAVGIIGRNGAGKSTLLKLLSRITEPSTGKIILNGRVASLLEVGTGFHPELTGRENIFLNGSILGMRHKEIKDKFDEIVDFSGVEKFLDTPVKRYSSGMYIRLAFAVAAHLEPEILVVDEVLAVGDAEFQKKCLGKMEDVSRSGRTVIFVSHNINAIQNLCTSGIFLEKGSLKYFGNINDTVNMYLQNDVVSSFLWKGEYGNDFVSILKTAIYNNVMEAKSIFLNSDDLTFEMVIKVKSDVNDLVAGIVIVNTYGDVILSSYYNDFLDARKLKAGTYRFAFVIPSYFLAVGSYTITLNIGIPYHQNIATNESDISFDINSQSEYGNAYMVDGHKWFNSVVRTNMFRELIKLED
jgi:lipopolysaccharide transport system ATP-binding protein